MKAQANTTREQSNKKSKQVGDPRTVEMEEQEKKNSVKYCGLNKYKKELDAYSFFILLCPEDN